MPLYCQMTASRHRKGAGFFCIKGQTRTIFLRIAAPAAPPGSSPMLTEKSVKHIPIAIAIAIVMSISHISGRATICGKESNEISPVFVLGLWLSFPARSE